MSDVDDDTSVYAITASTLPSSSSYTITEVLDLVDNEEEQSIKRLIHLGFASVFCISTLLQIATLFKMYRKPIPTKSRLLYYAASNILAAYVFIQGKDCLV